MRKLLGVPVILVAYVLACARWNAGARAMWRAAHHVAGEPIDE